MVKFLATRGPKHYCKDSFSGGAVYQNPTYNEAVCHCCGEFTNPINMGKPLCTKCFKKFPFI